MKHKILFLILFAALGTRLINITFPIAGWHSWRQSDTAAIARNFATEQYNILFPRIDWRGTTPGYIESEFQLFTFTIATLYSLFGVHEVFGRLLSLLCSLGTVIGLFFLARRIINERVALWSAFFYSLLPLNVFYGRAFMPEQLMLMCSVWGVLMFDRWIDAPEKKHLYFISLLFTTLAVVVKLPTLYIGLPIVYLCWNKYGSSFYQKPMIWIYAAVVLLITGAWYFHAHQLKEATGLTFGIWEAGSDKWGNIELLTSPKFYNDVFFKNIAERHFTYAAFIAFLSGLFLKRKYLKERLFDFWLIAVVIYILIVARGNQVHEYYQLPIMIPGVVFLGKAFARFIPFAVNKTGREKKLQQFYAFLLVVSLVLSALRLQILLNGEQRDSPIFRLAEKVRFSTPPESLIITVSEGNPVVLYHCQRKGWICSPGAVTEEYLAHKRMDGAKYLVAEKATFIRNNESNRMNQILKSNTVVTDTNEYFILAL